MVHALTLNTCVGRASQRTVGHDCPHSTLYMSNHDVETAVSETVSIHWHGIHPVDTPWTDGVGVTQAGIRPGENFTYNFRAWPAGTHYWHSHMDGMQSVGARSAWAFYRARFPSTHQWAGFHRVG